MSPMAEALLAQIAPDAEIVDAGALFAELWTIPDPEKPLGVAQAIAVAERCLAAMVAALRPGVRPRDLRGRGRSRECGCRCDHAGLRSRGRPARAGLVDVAATRTDAARHRARRTARGRAARRLGRFRRPDVTQCVRRRWSGPRPPSGTHSWARAAGATVGAIRARGAVVHGAGRGVEPWPDDLVLVPGLMVALEVRDDTSLRQDIVRITVKSPPTVARFGNHLLAPEN